MFSVKEILEITGGKLLRGSPKARVSGVSIDSRTIRQGHLFIAIEGKSFNGHDFLSRAVKISGAAVIVSKEKTKFKGTVPVILVKDTAKALGHLARFHRDKFSIPVVAITGSAGKTTTKEMVAGVLNSQFSVLKNIATQNNHIGVPMTLLQLNQKHDCVVVELGTNHFGEIRWLTYIANPTAAILTNIGESHLEFLKSLKGVLREKYDLVRYMKKRGAVMYNYDDPLLRTIGQKRTGRRLLRYAIEEKCDFQATEVMQAQNGTTQFTVNGREKFVLKSPARHNVYNALAAVCCGRYLNVSYKYIRKALGQFKFPKGRQQVQTVKGLSIIDDTYNANPISVRSAIHTLECLPTQGRKIFICADMLELGKKSAQLHRQIGSTVAQSAFDIFIAIGRYSRFMAEAARKENRALEVYHFPSVAMSKKRLRRYFKSGDTVLVKGSRGMKMEKVIDFLKENS